MKNDIELTLDGETVVLRPTLEAAITVDEQLGGFVEAFRQVGAFKLSAYVVIVAAGLGRRPNEVKTQVYNTGLASLAVPVTHYVTLLSNGGRQPEEAGKDRAAGEP